MHVKTKLGSVPAVAKVGTELVDEDRLFIQFFESCVQGLLPGMHDPQTGFAIRSPEEVLEEASEMAEMMLGVVGDRMEAEKFAKKL